MFYFLFTDDFFSCTNLFQLKRYDLPCFFFGEELKRLSFLTTNSLLQNIFKS